MAPLEHTHTSTRHAHTHAYTHTRIHTHTHTHTHIHLTLYCNKLKVTPDYESEVPTMLIIEEHISGKFKTLIQ